MTLGLPAVFARGCALRFAFASLLSALVVLTTLSGCASAPPPGGTSPGASTSRSTSPGSAASRAAVEAQPKLAGAATAGTSTPSSIGGSVAAAPTKPAALTQKPSLTAAATTEPAPAQATGPFRFSEVPEIVFVRGYAGREQLGIFHIDTGNRWTPGDLDNSSGWKPRVATELKVLGGKATGVRYDPATAELAYDGSGDGSETMSVQLAAPSQGAVSRTFRIRVLQPTVAWGVGAPQRYPGIGLDSSQVPWQDMQKSLRKDAADADPNVLFVTGGRYEGRLYIARGKRNLYILGDPKSRPVLANGSINIDDVELGYFKNFELIDTTINGSKFPTDRPVNLYITQVYQHDSTRDQNGISAPDYEGDSKYGIVTAPNTQTHWIWNFHGSLMGAPSNLRHQIYMHGRPAGYLNVNNIRVDASRACSIVKSTKYYNVVRNSRLSALVDPDRPEIGYRADKLLDIASASETIIYNNELIGAFNQKAKGTQNGLIALRARRTWWGSDTPAYPDVSYDPPRTSIAGGGYLAPKGFTAGPETFVDEAFWSAVASFKASDPQNPYTFKKYIAFNTFRWIDESAGRRPAIVDDGTTPRNAIALGSIAENWGSAPRNWVERSVTFLANNRYVGWQAGDVGDPKRWFDFKTYTSQALVTLVGPGPHPYPPPPRTVVDLGGEQTPTSNPAPIEIANWFPL
jgi:hypothetical protein